MKSALSCVVLSLVLVGCGGGTQSGPVTGHAINFYRLESSEVSRPNPDLSTFKAFAVLDDGGISPLSFVVQPDGGFSIADAPAGEYYVQAGTQFFVTQSRKLDLDDHSLQGRPDAVPATQAELVLTATGIEPQDFFEFEVISPEVGLMGVLDVEGLQQPTISSQATTLSANSGGLPDGTAADHTWVSELIRCNFGPDGGAVVLDGGAYRYCENYGPSAQLTGLDVDPDGGTALELALAPSTSKAVTATLDPAAYLAHQSDIHPGATPLSIILEVLVTPSATGLTSVRGSAPGVPLLVSYRAVSTPWSFSAPFFDPFPSQWSREIIWACSFDTPTHSPMTGSPNIHGVITEARPLDAAPATFTPRLSAPTAFTVDGHVAATDQTLASLTPLLKWSAPALGSATGYEGILQPLSDGDTAALNFFTAGTSFRVPAGVLKSGQLYAFQLAALFGPNLDLTNSPRSFYTATDSSLAMTVSGVWTAP